MVDAIGGVLPQFDPATRRFLLNVKRSCFNGREIGNFRGRAEWAVLQQIPPGLAERIAALEEQLRENDRAFAALYESELDRERRHLLGLLRDRRFLRGVALGRPGLVEKALSRARSFAASGSSKSPERWELSLLRFVTRAATKLSANSTLTAYSLGSVEASPGAPGIRFVDAPRREVSLVRLDRPQLEQLQVLLTRHPAVRERHLVAWNDSVEEVEPGRYSFVRDSRWSLEPGAREFRLDKPARVTVHLSEALVEALRDVLREGAIRYDALLALAPREELDRLIDLGLLFLLPPWPAWEPRLEPRILQLLRALPDEPGVRATADALAELLALEEGFASAFRPEAAVAAMKEAVARLFAAACRLAGHEELLADRAHFFEDVLLEAGGPEVFRISSSSVERIREAAGLVARFAGLFNLRHDVLHTLAAWWREHEPGRREAPFLEIARGFAPVWKGFIRFHATASEDALNNFDPLRTEALAALQERRKAALAGSRELLRESAGRDELPVRRFRELVESLPRRYAPQVGASVFVQPVDAGGGSWVLNRLHEGTGRYLSRVVPVLEGPGQRRLLDHLVARSVVEVEGEEAELLEVKQVFGNLVRAHPPQTARVLDVRGAHLDLPRARRVSLGELRVQADLEAETFRLVDAAGRRVLPVNLSTLSDNGHPNLLWLLLAFGPGETRGVFPLACFEGDEERLCFQRVTCASLVVRRRRWTVGVGRLRADLEGLGESRAHAVLHAWRTRLGLPLEGFCQDVKDKGLGGPKPQYFNFGSPLQCRL
ncbi:MAG: hypothetical protein ACJ759_18635, partial [Thermoanaerobaculia bacterium]